jgi:hypothetical protein
MLDRQAELECEASCMASATGEIFGHDLIGFYLLLLKHVPL